MLLRESILEADEDGAGEGRAGGGYREEEKRGGRGRWVGESQQGRAEVAAI